MQSFSKTIHFVYAIEILGLLENELSSSGNGVSWLASKILAPSADLLFNCSLLKWNIKSNEIEYEREAILELMGTNKANTDYIYPLFPIYNVIKGSIFSHLAYTKCSTLKNCFG